MASIPSRNSGPNVSWCGRMQKIMADRQESPPKRPNRTKRSRQETTRKGPQIPNAPMSHGEPTMTWMRTAIALPNAASPPPALPAHGSPTAAVQVFALGGTLQNPICCLHPCCYFLLSRFPWTQARDGSRKLICGTTDSVFCLQQGKYLAGYEDENGYRCGTDRSIE